MPYIETVVIDPRVDLYYEGNIAYSRYDRANASWTGTADWQSWIFYNGELFAGPLDFGAETDRTYEVPWTVGENQVLTIAEEPEGVTVTCPDYKTEGKPAIYWWPVEGAALYRIYRKETSNTSVEELEQEFNEVPLYTYYSWQSKFDFDTEEGKWHRFRIEVYDDQNDVESVSPGFYLFLHGYPSVPQNAQISGTGGVFEITVTK